MRGGAGETPFSETQDDRECHRVNYKMLSELFNVDE